MSVLLVQGTAVQIPLADQSVQIVCTSPPYYGLRSYGIGADAGELGSENTPDCLAWARGEPPCGEPCYVCALRVVAKEIWRVLRNDGTFWCVLGDSYSAGGNGGHQSSRSFHGHRQRRGDFSGVKKPPTGLAPKNLMGLPWSVALALRSDGWVLRSEIIWHKSNPMPESVTDRPTKAHEQVFLLTKQARYFYDAVAVREASTASLESRKRYAYGRYEGDGEAKRFQRSGKPDYLTVNGQDYGEGHQGRNCRDVWSISSEPTPFAHFATMPTALVTKCILAGTSAAGCCPMCHAPWVRQVERSGGNWEARKAAGAPLRYGMNNNKGEPITHYGGHRAKTTGWAPGCACTATTLEHGERSPDVLDWLGTPEPCTVLDCFSGVGTTGFVARALGRQSVCLELSWPYLQLARERLGLAALDRWTHGATPQATRVDDLPLFMQEDST